MPEPTQATTDDRFLGHALSILQPTTGYRAGLDAVLLAAACPDVREVLDVGAGVGVAGLAAAARLPATRVTLVERAPEMASLACCNIERNGLTTRCRVITADVTARLAAEIRDALGRERYDAVIANPPYHDVHRGRLARDPARRGALAMPIGDLDRWVRFMARMAAPHGRLVMIHRADAIAGILSVLEGRFGALTVLPLHSRTEAPAIRIIIAGIKASRAPLRILSGLVIHGEDGRFRPEIDVILRAPGPLPVDLFA